MTDPISPPSSPASRPPWLWIVIGAIGVVMAVTIAVLVTLLVTGNGDGEDDANSTSTSSTESTTTSTATTSTTTTAPAPTDPPPPPAPVGGTASPDEALATWVGDLGLAYFGDCDTVPFDVAGDGYCSLLQSDADGTLVYGLGVPFSEFDWWVRVQNQNDEWVVTDEADAFENPIPPF